MNPNAAKESRADPIILTGLDSWNDNTLLLIKSDAIKRGLEWRILQKFTDAGLKVTYLKKVLPSEYTLKMHYAEHQGKDFFPGLIQAMLGEELYLCLLEGPNALEKANKLKGLTSCLDSPAGTIRGDFGSAKPCPFNLVHTSDGEGSLFREVRLWFGDKI